MDDRFVWEPGDLKIVPPQKALQWQRARAQARALLLKLFDESQHPRDEHGRWADSGAVAFVSPNVEDLKIDGAIAGVNSARQQALRRASADVDVRLGKNPVEATNVVGAWTDGAENSLLMTMPKDWSHTQAKVAMAMKGWLGDQKSALLFTPDKAGNGFMASFSVKGDLAGIHQQLLDDGLANHTLEPITNGAMVHVYGEDQATADAVDKVAGQHDTQASFTFGKGEFIGTSKGDGTDREQRDDARRQYEAIIADAQAGSAFEGRDVGKIWDDLRARWGGELSPQQVDHSRTNESGGPIGDTAEEQQKFATEKLITDGSREGTSRVRVVKDSNVYLWGASHTGSSSITGHSAELMGIDGYRDLDPNKQAQNLGNKFLDVIAEGQGAGEPLYHGFRNSKGIVWKPGDIMKLPLTATSGDFENSAGYGTSYSRDDDYNKAATVFEFPPHTPIAGYSRWDRENTKDFGHTWSEAITAGEFKVTGTRVGHEGGWKKLPVTVVQLEPTALFDRASGQWRAL